MESSRKALLGYLDNLSILLVGIFLVGFPLIFSSQTTDAFILPKQLLAAVALLITLLLFGIRTIIDRQLRLRTTPFDLPLLLLIVIVFISSCFAINRYDAVIAFVPFLIAILLYFVIVNITRSQNAILFLASALVLGAVLTSLLAIFTTLKVYPLPMIYSHNQLFTSLGSLLDQAMYLALVLPLAGYIAWPDLNNGKKDQSEAITPKLFAFGASFLVILAGLGVTVYMLLFIQKPLILPFETGFQTALASISQDTGRVFTSFFFGSGFGTYMTDFTRYKQASYNVNPTLWSFTFFRSSSFVLELLATTGILGLLAFLFLVYRVFKQGIFFIPVVLIIIASFVLPFSSSLLVLFFVLIALFASLLALHHHRRFPDLEFQLVAFRHGLFSAVNEKENHPSNLDNRYSLILPVIFSIGLLVIIASISYFSVRYVISDITFQKSLIAASQNNGGLTYTLEADAIQMFPYRDSYYRIFSQTNLALANSLASTQPTTSSPSANMQQKILTLIQQSISSGRTAVTISPQTALNWNNLSSIYRSLIGFGQNADKFSIASMQQAILLDPNNPEQYISLGGIYYQLGAWDEAIREFEIITTSLKPDYGNAWYNLGHAFEAKGDLNDALASYQNVKVLVANDKTNLKKIDAEIAALQQKIGQQAKKNQANAQASANAQNQQPLDVNKPYTQLPVRNPKATIPGPVISITPTQQVQSTPSESPVPTK